MSMPMCAADPLKIRLPDTIRTVLDLVPYVALAGTTTIGHVTFATEQGQRNAK